MCHFCDISRLMPVLVLQKGQADGILHFFSSMDGNNFLVSGVGVAGNVVSG